MTGYEKKYLFQRRKSVLHNRGEHPSGRGGGGGGAMTGEEAEEEKTPATHREPSFLQKGIFGDLTSKEPKTANH